MLAQDIAPLPSMTATANPLTIRPSDVVTAPFPHIFSTSMIEPQLFELLRAEFPPDRCFDDKPYGGRTGRDFYPGDPGFDEFLAGSPAWRTFHDYINSERFMRFVLDCFGPYLASHACKVDPARAKYSRFVETREDLATHGSFKRRMARWIGGANRRFNDLYTRFDIEQGGTSYAKPVHCDHASRLASLVIYFSDADEIGMVGGDLQVHEHKQSKPLERYERHPRPEDTRVVRSIRPRANTGLLFLCSNNSYHGVTAIERVNGYRRFVYLNVSSRAEAIW